MSDLYLQINYARIVSRALDRPKVKCDNPLHINARCPICGDSATNKFKCRFHIREHEGSIFVSCFNCGYSSNLFGFLKVYHPNLYQELIFDNYKNGSSEHVITTPTVKFDESILISLKTSYNQLTTLGLPLVSDLPKDHPISRYVAFRHLPDYPFLYAERFYEFASKYNENLIKTQKDESRLVIPFLTSSGECFAFQGRDMSDKCVQKYITIRINKKIPNIFGLDRVDFTKPITIVEGPLDSLFLKNCLASVNASLVSTADKLNSIVKKENITLVYDCEPRNKAICLMYQDAINKGYRIVIWPLDDGVKVDINDLVNMGKNPQEIIEKNTYVGLSAQLAFDQWKRI